MLSNSSYWGKLRKYEKYD